MYYFISYTLFYVLNTQYRLKQASIAYLAIVANDGLFWLSIVTSVQLICDVMRKRDTVILTSYSSIVLARAQRLSSLVNNNREYRFLTNRYSRLSV